MARAVRPLGCGSESSTGQVLGVLYLSPPLPAVLEETKECTGDDERHLLRTPSERHAR